MPSLPKKHGTARQKRKRNDSTKARQSKRLYPTYSTYWRKHREQQLIKQPLCEHCLKREKISVATEVDHINGRADRQQDYTPSNYQSLCKPCHSTKTRSEQ